MDNNNEKIQNSDFANENVSTQNRREGGNTNNQNNGKRRRNKRRRNHNRRPLGQESENATNANDGNTDNTTVGKSGNVNNIANADNDNKNHDRRNANNQKTDDNRQKQNERNNKRRNKGARGRKPESESAQENKSFTTSLPDETNAIPVVTGDIDTEATDAEKTEIVGINFRSAGKIYYFAPGEISLSLGDKIIVETSRGTEMGVVKIPNKFVDAKSIVAPLRTIVRKATEDDIERSKANKELEISARAVCKKKISEHKLDMHLVDVEYTFDNSKLIFYFTSEGRVDFRDLVKDLAGVFKTRIELRQIGIRDETKMVGGLGACGRPYCCSEFLTDFVQVSIKMAKEQNFSLNSAKISGSCGRLMCCLRYEHEAYEEALLKTPPCGSVVKTSSGTGVVVETRPLLHLIKVRMDDRPDNLKLLDIDDVTVIKSQKTKKDNQKSENAESGEEPHDN